MVLSVLSSIGAFLIIINAK